MRMYYESLLRLLYLSRLALFPVVASLILCLLLSQSSQGLELALAAKQGNASSSAIVWLCALYCALSLWIATASVVSVARRTPALSRKSDHLLSFWCSAIVCLGFLSIWLGPWSVWMLSLTIGLSFLALPLSNYIPLHMSSRWPVRSRSYPIATIVLVVIGMTVVLTTIVNPVRFPRDVGSTGIVFLAVGFWSLMASLVFVVLPMRFGLPSLSIVPLIMFVWFSRYNDNHQIRATQEFKSHPPNADQTDRGQLPFTEYVRNWLLKTCNAPNPGFRRCPVIMVAAEGGGLRAAYWTTRVLLELDKDSQGEFSKHLFAISGVSGGALGGAAFVAAKADNQPQVTEASLEKFLSDDFLSPALAGLLFPDLFQRFLPLRVQRFDRAVTFEKALETSWQDTFGNDQFSQNILNLPTKQMDGTPLPALFLNSTNVESGKRFIVSSLLLPKVDQGDSYYAFDPEALYHITAMPLSAAVNLAARFPYISPHAVVMSPATDLAQAGWPPRKGPAPTPLVWGRLIDGGYYENSGTATLNDVVGAFVNAFEFLRTEMSTDLRPEIIVVVISNDPAPLQFSTHTAAPSEPSLRPIEPPREVILNYRSDELTHFLDKSGVWSKSVFLSELLSPVDGMLATRDGRAASERRMLARRIDELRLYERSRCASEIFKVPNTLEGLELLHLKWMLAPLDGDERKLAFCTPIRGYEEISLGRYLADARLEATGAGAEIATQLRNPGLGWFLSQPSRVTMDRLVSEVKTNVQLQGWETGSIALKALDMYYNPPKEEETLKKEKLEPVTPYRATPCRLIPAGSDLGGPLLIAAGNGDVSETRCLLKKHAPKDVRDPVGHSPLYYAVAFKHIKEVTLLLGSGADPDLPVGTLAETPLMRAVADNNATLVQILLDGKAKVDHAGGEGVTPLMIAANYCEPEIVEILLRKHPHLSLRNSQGQMAEDLARRGLSPCPQVALRLGRSPKSVSQR